MFLFLSINFEIDFTKISKLHHCISNSDSIIIDLLNLKLIFKK